VSADNHLHLEHDYALALQFGYYRRAAWIAIRGARRPSQAEQIQWRWRLQGCMRRRHGH